MLWVGGGIVNVVEECSVRGECSREFRVLRCMFFSGIGIVIVIVIVMILWCLVVYCFY